jgi:peroxiredoxin
MALTHTPEPEINSPCPDFTLKGIDGRTYNRADFAGQPFLAMFICVHCPYVLAVEDRLVELGQFFAGKPIRIAAICSNDSVRYPADSFENMKKQAAEKKYPFPYLHDETQAAAHAFGAVCTPDFFLYDAELRLQYRGRLDDSWKDPKAVRSEELKAAMAALLEGKSSMGCSIKWKM